MFHRNAPIIVEPIRHQGTMTRGGCSFDAEKGDPASAPKRLAETLRVERVKNFSDVELHKYITKLHPRSLCGPLLPVGIILLLADGRCRSKLRQILVSDAACSQSCLKPSAVGKCVLRASDSAALSDVAEEVNASAAELVEKLRF